MGAEELEGDQDQDSLFGSPPPSPRPSGRPASPALALPSAANTSVANVSVHLLEKGQGEKENQKNVGTIALPGSQLDSELPIHPLALSLSHGVVHRPPALLIQKKGQVQTQPNVVNKATTSADATTSSSSVSMSRRTVGRTTGKDKTTKKRQRPSATPSQSTSRSSSIHPETGPPPLEFSLPDPTAPPPTHFLRNQENLLGRAGRVAGVKPTMLTHMRGSTPANPICLDDGDDEAAVEPGESSRESKSKDGANAKTKPLHPPLSNEEIVSVLIAQKDIFPVLESLLNLLAKGSGSGRKPVLGPRLGGFESRLSFMPSPTNVSAFVPPPKKRKLTHVPAGASDWDVPFPFEEGEGPEYYKQTWEMERGRQLVNELVKMVRGAVGKVLAKKGVAVAVEKGIGKTKNASNGVVKPTAETKVQGHYRPETATYGQVKVEGEEVIAVNHQAPSLSISPPGSASGVTPILNPAGAQTSQIQPQFQPCDSLDQLLTSFMDVDMPGSTTTATFSPTFVSTSDFFPRASLASVSPLPPTFAESQTSLPANPSLADDQTMFDTWMNFLEAFPIPFDGGTSTSSGSSSISGLSGEGTRTTTTTTTTTPTPTTATTTPSVSLRSTPTPALEAPDFSVDFDSFLKSILNAPGLELPGPGSGTSNVANVGGQDNSLMDLFGLEVSSAMPGVVSSSTSVGGIGTEGIGDHLVDPALLAISSSMMVNAGTPSSIPTGSVPVTPVSVGWDGSHMIGDDPTGGEPEGLGLGQGMCPSEFDLLGWFES